MLTHLNFQEVHAHTTSGVISLDENALIVYANPTAIHDLFAGMAYMGLHISKFIKDPAAAVIDVHSFFQESTASKEYIFSVGDTNLLDVLVSSAVYTDDTQEKRAYLFLRNISRLKKKENLFSYLNTASERLALARDTQTALDQISRLIVPKFANWFSIDILRDGNLEELVLAHEDPDMIQWARRYREAYPTDLNSDSGAAKVIKTGIPSLVTVITEDMITASIKNPDQLAAIKMMNLQSVIMVAIFIKDAVVGIINFVSSTNGHHYDEADLSFAQSFANHIALALENARLNEAAAAEISARKQIEERLRVTQVQLKSALSSGLVGTWIFDASSDIFYADENLARMFGIEYSASGHSQELFRQMVHPDDRHLIDAQRKSPVTEGQVYETEYRVIVNGATHWFFARGQTEASVNGQPQLFSGVIIDVTERKQAELALKENEELFRFLTNAIPHKLWTSGPDGRATYYNQGWYDYTGAKTFEELKENIWDILHPDDREKAAEEWPKAIAKGKEMTVQQRLRRHDGQYRWHLSRFSAHKDEAGKIVLWVGTSTDINEQKENEQRKDEFLSIASHELKTPLTSIKAFNQIMKRANPQQPLIGFIDKSAEHIYRLERLISDLLDVTKLNAGKMNYTNEPFQFEDMLADSVENLQYNTTHEIVLENTTGVTYNGDRFRLEQVMNNLLSNAIKYSPGGKKIVVNSKLEHNSIIVSVQDFGIGIAPENLTRLFDRYYRVDNTAMRFEGLGLGLYISSEILKRHHGSFWIESEQGKGSTFYFRLPLNQVSDKQGMVKTKDLYRDEHITIIYNEEKQWLDVDWTGYQDLKSVQQGCMLMLEYLQLHQVDRVVNDNTHVMGNWADAVDWVGNTWFPMMEKAGLKYFAHIFSPSTFSQLSAKKSIDIMAGIITTQYFTEIKLAEEWLAQFPR